MKLEQAQRQYRPWIPVPSAAGSEEDCLHLRLENIDIDVWCREDDATKACNYAIAARNTELA